MKLRFALIILLFGVISSPLALHAGTISLQDFAVNVNGTSYDYNNLGDTDPTTLTGMNATGFSSYTTGDTLGTGLGSLIYTFNAAPGAYFVNFYFDLSAGVPFYNEFGTAVGAPPAGTSWEIAQVNPSVGGIQFWSGASETFPNSLDNTNHVPGTGDNYLLNCASNCNADVAMALGYSFVLGAGEQAVITITLGTVVPQGFYLQQTHPVDANLPDNAVEQNLYLHGGLNIQPIPVGGEVPEPAYWPIMGMALAAVVGIQLRRKSLAN